LRALDVPPDRIPVGLDERSALWRAELANRRVLLLLDNAASTGQVRPLLPGSPTCLALITSRRQLADLETTGTLSLDVLPEADALSLFTSVVGADRVWIDPESTSDVLRLCGYLPLAIRIAAARLRSRPAWPVRALADRLRDETRRHDELTVGDRSVTAALALSYQRLTEPQQRLFSLLGQHPGTTFDSYQAAALGGIPLFEAERLLTELVDMHLVKEREPGRYRLHDLVRQYARTKTSVPEPIRHDAIGRLLDHYLYLARLTDAYLGPDNPICADRTRTARRGPRYHRRAPGDPVVRKGTAQPDGRDRLRGDERMARPRLATGQRARMVHRAARRLHAGLDHQVAGRRRPCY